MHQVILAKRPLWCLKLRAEKARRVKQKLWTQEEIELGEESARRLWSRLFGEVMPCNPPLEKE